MSVATLLDEFAFHRRNRADDQMHAKGVVNRGGERSPVIYRFKILNRCNVRTRIKIFDAR